MQHGDVRGAVGAEYRRAEIDDTPSIDMQNGNLYNFTSAAITRGKDSVGKSTAKPRCRCSGACRARRNSR